MVLIVGALALINSVFDFLNDWAKLSRVQKVQDGLRRLELKAYKKIVKQRNEESLVSMSLIMHSWDTNDISC